MCLLTQWVISAVMGSPSTDFAVQTKASAFYMTRDVMIVYSCVVYIFFVLNSSVILQRMTPRKLILLLGVVAVLVTGYAFLKKPAMQQQLMNGLGTPAPTPVSGTFLDGIIGQFVFYTHGNFFEMMLPFQKTKQLALVDDTVKTDLPAIKPIWSPDGKLFALMSDRQNVLVVNYQTGEKVVRVKLPEALPDDHTVTLSFSPNLQTILIADSALSTTYHFVQLIPEKIVIKAGCSPLGVWLLNEYVTTCGDTEKTILALTPGVEGVRERKLGSGAMYELLNKYNDRAVVVKKGDTIGSLSLTGAFTVLPKKEYDFFPSIDAMRSPEKAFAARVMESKHTDAIDDIVVSSNHGIALFHTAKGIWAIDLKLTSEPVFVVEGSLPTVRP